MTFTVIQGEGGRARYPVPVAMVEDGQAFEFWLHRVHKKEHSRILGRAVPLTDQAREIDECFGPYYLVEIW